MGRFPVITEEIELLGMMAEITKKDKLQIRPSQGKEFRSVQVVNR